MKHTILLAISILFCNTIKSQTAGVISNILAGEPIPKYSAVYISGGKAYKSDVKSGNNAVAVSIVAAALTNDTIQVIYKGQVQGSTYIGVNNTYYTGSTSGSIQNTKPAGIITQVMGYSINDSIFIVDIGDPQYISDILVLKKVNESVSSDATLGNDSELSYSLLSGSEYTIDVDVYFSSANANMDYKYATAYTGTFTSSVYNSTHIACGGTTVAGVKSGTGAITSTAVAATTTGIGFVSIRYYVKTNTAGIFSFTWAQNTSDAAQLTVLAGSKMTIKKI